MFLAMRAQTTEALDLSDVLRAALVTSVSALDLYIHELVKLGMLQAYLFERVRTQAFLRFQVSLLGVLQASSNFSSTAWLEQEIGDRQGHQSFQTPDNIADAIRLISEVELWNEVSCSLGSDRREIRDRLNLIVDRRNKIVHEADIIPDYAGQTAYSEVRSPIDETIVADAIDFIDQVAVAIYGLVVTPPPDTTTG